MRQLAGGIHLADMGSPQNAGRVLALYGLPEYVHQAGWTDAAGNYLAKKVLATAANYTPKELSIPGFWPDLLAPYTANTSTEHYTIDPFTYPKGPITLAAWAYLNDTSGPRPIAGEYTASGAASALVYVYNGRLQVYISTTGTGSAFVDNAGAVSANKWTHVAMTWDGATLTGYVNGKFIAGGSSATTGTSIVPAKLHLGFTTGAAGNLQGYWGDVGVWNRCLNQRELENYVTLTRFGHEALTYTLPRPQDRLAIAAPTPVSGYAMGIDNAAALHAAAARRRNIVFSLPPAWSIDPSQVAENVTLDKYHAPLAVAAPRPRPNLFAQIRGEFGDIPRPFYQDPLPANQPVWHVPLAQQPAPKEKDRRLLMPFGSLGDVPRPEVVTADKWTAEVRIAHRRRPEPPPHADYATDGLHLLDAEGVAIDKFYAPLARLLPGRARQLYVPDATIFQDEVFPADPVSYQQPPWHVVLAIAARNVRTRDRHEWYSDGGVLLGVPGLILEDVKLGFHTPMTGVPPLFSRRRTPPLPIGGIDLDAPQRLERVFEDAFREMGLPAWVARKAAPFWAATLTADSSTVVEQPHVDAFLMPSALPTALRRSLAAAWEHDQAALLLAANFAPPLIPRIRRWMLAAGFWRARY